MHKIINTYKTAGVWVHSLLTLALERRRWTNNVMSGLLHPG